MVIIPSSAVWEHYDALRNVMVSPPILTNDPLTYYPCYCTWAVLAVTAYLVARWIVSQTSSVMDRICHRTYIYNCCWEDPAVDHEILSIQPDDVIFRICSAGDIVLDYAIEGPAKIVVCDMNQHQYVFLVVSCGYCFFVE